VELSVSEAPCPARLPLLYLPNARLQSWSALAVTAPGSIHRPRTSSRQYLSLSSSTATRDLETQCPEVATRCTPSCNSLLGVSRVLQVFQRAVLSLQLDIVSLAPRWNDGPKTRVVSTTTFSETKYVLQLLADGVSYSNYGICTK
jgi:hypothetical protein